MRIIRLILVTLVLFNSSSGCSSVSSGGGGALERAYRKRAELEDFPAYIEYGDPGSGPRHGSWNIEWGLARQELHVSATTLDRLSEEHARKTLERLMRKYGVVSDFFGTGGFPARTRKLISTKEIVQLIQQQEARPTIWLADNWDAMMEVDATIPVD